MATPTHKSKTPQSSATTPPMAKWEAMTNAFLESSRPAPEPICAPRLFMQNRPAGDSTPSSVSRPPIPVAPQSGANAPAPLPVFPLTASSPGGLTAAPFPVMINTAAPFPPPTGASSPAAAPSAASATAPAITPAAPSSGGIPVPTSPPFCNSQPLSVNAFTRLLKLGISATILFFACYFTIKSAYPFLMELSKPGSTKATGKDAPIGVQVLRQTRGVVDKNNANVARLNALIDAELGGGPELAPLPTLPPPPAQPKPIMVAKPAPTTSIRAIHNAIDELHIHGVVGGKEPRVVVNGLLVGIGSVVDAKLGLKFIDLDESRRVILLSNENGQTFRKKY